LLLFSPAGPLKKGRLALKAKADELAEEQRAAGEMIQEANERRRPWIDRRQAAAGNGQGGD
jgi:hypothetical protein